MKNMILNALTLCAGLFLVSCTNDTDLHNDLVKHNGGIESSKDSGTPQGLLQELSQGAIQLSGIAYFDADDECNTAGEGATFSLVMTGDLVGCLYTYVDEYDCSPSGTYREIGREYFVGTYNEVFGTFWTNYRFEAKYEGCAEDGSYVGPEIKGRCQHPVVNGSGTGIFEGVTGRLDFKDDIEAGNYPYRGHFRGLNQ